MKKFQFLLLDAGPILKLFELGLWEHVLGKCDVTIWRTVAEEARWASGQDADIRIDLDVYDRDGRIRIEEVPLSQIKTFHEKFDLSYQAELHDGERETLSFLYGSPEDWLVCTADGAVFRALGLPGRGDQGVSLERLLAEIWFGHQLEWKFTEQFRHKYTALGQIDAAQGVRTHRPIASLCERSLASVFAPRTNSVEPREGRPPAKRAVHR